MNQTKDSAVGRPAPTRDAATILLVRDGAKGVEIFMLVRHTRLDFASGAMVFPGGGVDEHDRDPALRTYLPEAAKTLDDNEIALRVAAIREAYEESGVLLARARGQSSPIDAERLAKIDARYESERRAHRVDLGAIAREEELEIAADLLTPFAHWITPTTQPKRFDTRFYIARAPADHVAVHDGHESVESTWMNAHDICREADQGQWHVMFPTRMNLQRVGASPTVDDALAAARTHPIVPVLPETVERLPEGRRLRIPAEAGYGVEEVVVSKDGGFRPIT